MKTAIDSMKLTLLAAGIAVMVVPCGSASAAATRMVRAEPEREVGLTQPETSLPEGVQDKRTPVISLTRTVGDVGMEIFDGQTRRYNLATLPKNVTSAIVYVDVDGVEWNGRRMQSVLDLAKKRNWVVMAESSSWDVPRLHAFINTYYPQAKTDGLKNVAARIGWDQGRPVATELVPSDAAVEVGIDYAQTSAGKALMANTFTAKTVAPGSTLAWFANNAYQPTASYHIVYTVPWKVYEVVLNLDVVKVWRYHNGATGYNECVVGWRGSSTTGDWARNFESQFGFAVAVPGNPTTNEARIGHGYASRLANYKDRVNAIACNSRAVTGHSLGGGMAEAYAYTKRGMATTTLESYNPARVGNAAFRTQLVGSMTYNRIKVFCRHGDPVWYVPALLQHVGNNSGCTYWGAQLPTTNLIANHNMELWL